MKRKYDNCVYLQKLANGSFIYLPLYVDDMLIAAKDKSEIIKLKAKLNSKSEMKDLGAAKKILGIEISKDRNSSRVFLSQQKYDEKILERFAMQVQSH